MAKLQKITPNLWFAHEAEEAARYYVSIFDNSGIEKISYYSGVGQDVHKMKPGSVMTVVFHLDGQQFMALNGGPVFEFNEAVSFIINCDTQEELDHYWNKLTEGGDPGAQVCGWLKDKYGLSWQVVPTIFEDFMASDDQEKVDRVFAQMLTMKKLDIEPLKQAFYGGTVAR